MGFLKKMFLNIRTRVWAIVSIVMTILIVVVSSLASTVFYQVICMAISGERVFGRGEGRYYELEAKDKEDAYRRGNLLNEEICEEGFVLLKNKNSALPLKTNEKKISIFGKNSVKLVYGGTGSGGGSYNGATTLHQSLKAAGFEINPILEAFYSDNKKSGEGRTPNPKIENGGAVQLLTGETPQSSYTKEIKDSYSEYSDVALIVFSRVGGEGFDLPRTMPDEPDKHYLELDANEEALVDAVTAGPFGKVIVLFNCSTTVEAGAISDNPLIDACISIGSPGYSGINALGKLLNGKGFFSGKTVDTWARDFKANPVWNNFGNNLNKNGATYYTVGDNSSKKYEKYYFVDYEEGIYVGYRYYETRGAEDKEWYKNNVVYPFGYGLSYTDFSWEVQGDKADTEWTVDDSNKNGDIEIKVKVTNTGAYAGKDVVELYCAVPYSGKVEKASVVLAGFAKTPVLYPLKGKAANSYDAADENKKPNSAVVTIKFNPYTVASYDYSDANKNGFYGYELEEGKYKLKLQTDSNTVKEGIGEMTFAVGTGGVKYQTDGATGKPVINRFPDADEELDTVLSRNDWEGTWPTVPDGHNFADYSFNKKELSSFVHNNPEENWPKYKMNVKTDKKLIEMRGLDYNDEGWEEILDSLTFKEMRDLFNEGAFKTSGIPRIGLPETISSDGPVGFVNFINGSNVYGTVSYASEYVIGSTWNTELLERLGKSVGEEGNYGKQTANPYIPYSGWYAPGMNLHRSPFGGRNFEYFSEDPYLTGMLASAQIRGAESKGVVTYMKHFALNEQETHRDDNGVCTWATEQAIREIYLRPFEIAVKTASPKGIMTSFNRIGTKWTGGDYRLVTEILRGEWGFKGTVISDFNVSLYMNPKQMIYAGGDLNLTTTRPWMNASESSPSDVAVLRRAAHNIMYTVVNSNAMNGVNVNTVFRVAMPIWQVLLIVGDCVIITALSIWGVFEIRKFVKNKK